MKYRIKREIPFAKQGVVLHINENHLLCNEQGAYIGYNEDDIAELLKDGWIEEVREPREWYLTEYGGCNSYIGYIYNTKESAEKCGLENYRIIKVREVEE